VVDPSSSQLIANISISDLRVTLLFTYARHDLGLLVTYSSLRVSHLIHFGPYGYPCLTTCVLNQRYSLLGPKCCFRLLIFFHNNR